MFGITKTGWKRKIKKACEDAGTYRPFFDSVIDTLAGIMERRSLAEEAFEKSGGKVVVVHTNKGGGKNLEQNPALRLINDLNRDALAYWRDLGLTPAGLKKLNADVVQDKNEGSFEKLLSKIMTND